MISKKIYKFEPRIFLEARLLEFLTGKNQK